MFHNPFKIYLFITGTFSTVPMDFGENYDFNCVFVEIMDKILCKYGTSLIVRDLKIFRKIKLFTFANSITWH